MEKLFVIALENDAKQVVTFCGYDADCGYLMDAKSLSGAHKFRTLEQAEKVYNGFLTEKTSVSREGVKLPPDYLQRGFDLSSHTNSFTKGQLAILELSPVAIRVESVEARVVRPVAVNFVYPEA